MMLVFEFSGLLTINYSSAERVRETGAVGTDRFAWRRCYCCEGADHDVVRQPRHR